MTRWYEVAVVGGGASGTFLAAQMLRDARGWKAFWIASDDSGGAAYSTRFDSHLLNVPAARMGAFVEEPEHFHRWLEAHPEGRVFGATDFVPRRLYGEYLRALRAEVSRSPLIDVSVSRAEIIEPVEEGTATGWRVSLQDGSTIYSRRLVLATGLSVDRQVDQMIESGLVRDPWEWLRTLPDHWSTPNSDRAIKIIGSGLTAMDVTVALRDLGFAGPIRVLSRSGKWSATHEATEPLADAAREALIAEMLAAPSCLHYARTLRLHRERRPWRAVLDALRPASQSLWVALPLIERKRFLRHMFGLWNRHRHRAPPATAKRIAADERLSLRRGRSFELAADEAFVIDCRGLGLTAFRAWPQFIVNLLDRGALAPSPLGIGVESKRPDSLEVLGALRFGTEFECTAVPELRLQAATLLERWQKLRDPRSEAR